MKKSILLLLVLFVVKVSAQFDSNREYTIESRSTGRFAWAFATGQAKFSYSKSKSQWNIIDNGDEFYKIHNVETGRVLSVASTVAGESVIAEAWTGAASQKWTLTQSEGYYSIVNANSGLALTAINEKPTAPDPNPDQAYYDSYSSVGAAVQETYTGLNTQQFHIAPIKLAYEEALVVPQLGWRPEHVKTALLISNTSISNPAYQLIENATDNVVASGTMTLWTATSTWDQYYYIADLTSLTATGSYHIEANGLSVNVTIGTDIYSNLKYAKGGTISFSDMFDGFWKYNKGYSGGQTLSRATMELIDGKERFTLTGETYESPDNFLFDAHSRDSKLGRTAKALGDFCLAYMHTENAADKAALEAHIRIAAQNLLDTQNPDGSYPTGRVRQDVAPRVFYYWTENIDANTAARVAKSFAMVNQILKESDPSFAATVLTAGEKAWDFAINNENLVDININVSYKGQSVDILAAAVEMAYATGETEYFNKADAMINNGEYDVNGVFRAISGTLPNAGPNRYAELDNGTLPNICRYYSIARTQAMKDQVQRLADEFMAHWTSFNVSPFGFPEQPLNRPNNFGNVVQVEKLTFAMLAVADYMNNTTAYGYAISGFHFLTGLNPYATSYIQGLGDPSITPSVNFMKRSYDDGIGSMLPGFTYDGTSFIQSPYKYHNTEGVVPTNSTLFYMLSRFNSLHVTVPTHIPGAIETELQSNLEKFHLYDNYPNPFNPETTISFDLSGRSYVKLEIYNILGQLVKTIIDQELSPATYSYKWDGKDKNGHLTGTGIYLYRLESSFGTEVKKMTFMK
ncbi:MAG: RICIN domain-containing protein [Melioribacteraceae bacterium]|nr:RICIN domain-containing protein [Melioribacteraceae bacterium]